MRKNQPSSARQPPGAARGVLAPFHLPGVACSSSPSNDCATVLMGRSRGPGGGSLLAEREVSSLPSISLPPKAAQGGFATALPRERRTIYKRITLCYTAGETEASAVGQCSEAVIAGVS